MPSIVGGLDIHRKQITFDYLDTITGEVARGRVAPADRAHLRAPAFGDLGRAGAPQQLAELAAAHLPAAGQLQIGTCLRMLDAIEAELGATRRRLVAAARHLRGAQVLHDRIYGVGPVTALA